MHVHTSGASCIRNGGRPWYDIYTPPVETGSASTHLTSPGGTRFDDKRYSERFDYMGNCLASDDGCGSHATMETIKRDYSQMVKIRDALDSVVGVLGDTIPAELLAECNVALGKA